MGDPDERPTPAGLAAVTAADAPVKSAAVTTESAWDRYLDEIRALHTAAGAPSSRTIAGLVTGEKMSHTTVNDTLMGKRLPTWPVLDRIVAALGGDRERFLDLWGAVRTEAAGDPPMPPLPSMSTNERILHELAAIRALLEKLVDQGDTSAR